MKKCINMFMCAAMMVFAAAIQVNGAAIQYERKTSEPITRAVYYEVNNMVTNAGLRDVHVITIDLTSEHVQIRPVHSQTEHGLKETTSSLLRSNGAIAGVNGDFFGLAGTHSAPFGLTIVDGHIKSMSEGSNANSMEFATFLLDDENNPFIQYVQSTVSFWNNGEQNIDLYSINRTSDMNLPTYIDRNAFTSTQPLDARFPDLYKIVVENETIVHISGKGEIVDVPENGFVIVMSESTANYNLHSFNVGDTGRITTYTGVELSTIHTAISGASKILSEGQPVSDGHIVTGRQPRTALGISEDKTKLILMVVDGRSHSIGATHDEMAFLMQYYGAYDAMHLDGGGSSTMLVQTIMFDSIELKNNVSDGSERRVINALGVFNNSEPSDLTKLYINPSTEIAFRNMPVKLNVQGFDDYYNRIAVEGYDLIMADESQGHISDGYLYPTVTGNIEVFAVYGDIISQTSIYVTDIAQLNPSSDMLSFKLGDSYTFKFNATGVTGRTADINASALTYEVVPSSLGTVDNGIFTPQGAGAGYIKASIGDVSSYIKVSIGRIDGEAVYLEYVPAKFSMYPETSLGSISHNPNIGISLNYRFMVSEDTQAAYVVFDNPITFANNPVSLKLYVYGDSSNNWLRGTIRDANDQEHTIDFTRNIDFADLRTLEANIPSNVAYPISLERVYVASLQNNDAVTRTLIFTSVLPQYAVNDAAVTLPQSTLFVDPLSANLSSAPVANEFDVTFIGNIVASEDKRPTNYEDIQNSSLASFNSNSSFGFFMGNTDRDDTSMPAYKRSSAYNSYELAGVLFIQMTLRNGSLYGSDTSQWRGLNNMLDSSNHSNVVILFDRNPLVVPSSQELQLFNDLLIEHQRDGKNIFVVSNDGVRSSSTIKDGIRYINVPDLWNTDGTLNRDFKTLRIRFNGYTTLFDFR